MSRWSTSQESLRAFGIAASKGIRLTKLVVSTECNVNFAKTFDISNDPIIEGICFQIEMQVENADRQKLQDLLKMAEERCLAVYSIQMSSR